MKPDKHRLVRLQIRRLGPNASIQSRDVAGITGR